MTYCPTCGADPCINANFCRLCREADRKLARTQREEKTGSEPAQNNKTRRERERGT